MSDLDKNEKSPGIGKEAKFGIAVILGLIAVLGVVVTMRVASPGKDARVDVAENGPDVDSEGPAGPREATVVPEASPVAKGVRDVVAMSSGREKPVVPAGPKPTILSPENNEPSAGRPPRWRQSTVADGQAATDDDPDSRLKGSYMPVPPRPAPDDPGGRYGRANAAPPPPDMPAGFAVANAAPDSAEPSDSRRARRSDAPPEDGLQVQRPKHSGPESPDGPSPQPTYTPRQDASLADRTRTVSERRLAAGPDPNAGRRGDGTYEVQPNDSFWTISEKLYGTGAYFQALAEHNRERATNRNRLRVGQILATPDVAELEQKYPALCPKPEHRHVARHHPVQVRAGQRGAEAAYTVVEGDTLYRIARYELGDASRWHELYQLNREVIGESFNHLRPGTQLVLPERTGSESTDILTRRPGSLY